MSTSTTNPSKALWEKGDFTRIAETMRESGEQLVGELGVTPGMRVLDVGCGDGTTAVPEARLGADVLGVDIASNLVATGNARAQELGLDNLTFQEGDASHDSLVGPMAQARAAVPVVHVRGPIHAHANADSFLDQEFAPLVRQERSVGLDRLLDSNARRVALADEVGGALIE